MGEKRKEKPTVTARPHLSSSGKVLAHAGQVFVLSRIPAKKMTLYNRWQRNNEPEEFEMDFRVGRGTERVPVPDGGRIAFREGNCKTRRGYMILLGPNRSIVISRTRCQWEKAVFASACDV